MLSQNKGEMKLAVMVRKANKILQVPEEKLGEYLEMGYCQIGENGEILRRKKSPLEQLMEENARLLMEQDALKQEIAELKEGQAPKKKTTPVKPEG